MSLDARRRNKQDFIDGNRGLASIPSFVHIKMGWLMLGVSGEEIVQHFVKIKSSSLFTMSIRE
jgi:hypothetical protein